MERIGDRLDSVVQTIQQRQKKMIDLGVAKGKTDSLERLWHEIVKEKWEIRSFAFTDREKANMKMFAGEFDKEAGAIIIDAIRAWRGMRASESLSSLSEMPEFGSFFHNRKKIYGWIKEEERKEERRTEALRKIKSVEESFDKETAKDNNGLDLIARVKAVRKKIREEREKSGVKREEKHVGRSIIRPEPENV